MAASMARIDHAAFVTEDPDGVAAKSAPRFSSGTTRADPTNR
jgi:hypothetical protein